MTNQFKVEGKGTQSDNRSPMSSVTVRAFDKGLPSLGVRSERQLGVDALTDVEGRYKITFDEEEFRAGDSHRRGKLRPDLFVRVFDDDLLLGASPVHFKASEETPIDLTIERPEAQPMQSSSLGSRQSSRVLRSPT